jgi:hypothetical protein
MNDFNDSFYNSLFDIQRRRRDLFEEECDILDDFHLARSFRRGATTRAQLAEVPDTVIEWGKPMGNGHRGFGQGTHEGHIFGKEIDVESIFEILKSSLDDHRFDTVRTLQRTDMLGIYLP